MQLNAAIEEIGWSDSNVLDPKCDQNKLNGVVIVLAHPTAPFQYICDDDE